MTSTTQPTLLPTGSATKAINHRTSNPTMVMKGASSLGEVVMNKNHHHHQYASTPHLFVFQTVDDDDEDEASAVDDTSSSNTNVDGSQNSSKEPIYSSAIEVRKNSKRQEMDAVQRISEKYDTIGSYTRQDSYPPEDPLAVTDDDVARIETFFRGHRTQVWVCRTMANLYNENDSGASSSWKLRFTGVPLLLLDSGDTKSRNKRQLQIILAEKGTGFALWRDVVDNLTSYRVQEPHFHTFYLSSDHRQRLGLSYNDGKVAMEFYSILEQLTSDPANICLSGPGKKKKEKPKEKPIKYKPPKKTDISLPCNFNHVTNVDPADKSRFFSLQLFSRNPTAHPIQPPPVLDKLQAEEHSLKQRVIQV